MRRKVLQFPPRRATGKTRQRRTPDRLARVPLTVYVTEQTYGTFSEVSDDEWASLSSVVAECLEEAVAALRAAKEEQRGNVQSAGEPHGRRRQVQE